MDAVEALQIALSKEEQAIEMYRKMAVEFPAIHELLEELQDEEYKHRERILKKLAEIRG